MPQDKTKWTHERANVWTNKDDGLAYAEVMGKMVPIDEMTAEDARRVFINRDEYEFYADENKKRRKAGKNLDQFNPATGTLTTTQPPKMPPAVEPVDEGEMMLVEAKDDEQILAEIQGKVLEQFVYYPTKDPRTGEPKGDPRLSYAGIKTICQRMGGISVLQDVKISETDDTYRIMVWSVDKKRDITVPGVCEQSKKMQLKSGELVHDPYAFQKAMSKAIRNSWRLLIPEYVAAQMIAEWLDKQKRRGNGG